MTRFRSTLLTTAFVLAATLALAPAAGAIDSCTEFPFADSINIARNMAAPGKGLQLYSCLTTDPPIQIGDGTTVDLTFDGGPTVPSCTANDELPDLGQCGFVTIDQDNDGDDDTLRIYFGDLLPASDTVTVDVQDLEDGAADTFSTSWSFDTAAETQRDPAAIELVFDISGSMGWPAGTVTRMEALKTAAGALFDLLDDYTIAGDQIGAIYFSNAATAFDAPPGSNLKAADDPAQVGPVQTDLNGQTPTNATSIGAGLDLADSPTGFGATTARKFVLLFSDGEQNRSPMVDVPDGDGTLQVGGADYDSSITVCPITAGCMTAPGFALQQDIADASCDGNNQHVQSTEETHVVADLESFFLQNLSDILIGDKLELVRDVTGQVIAGSQPEQTFLAGPDDLLLSILLSWSPALPVPPELDVVVERDVADVDLQDAQPGVTTHAGGFLLFELEAPDGTVVDLSGRTRFGPGRSFTTIRLPATGSAGTLPLAGEWTVRLLGDDLPIDELGYHLVVMLDNTTLASEFSIAAAEPVTGEDIVLEATLGELGTPVTGGVVVASLLGPREGLGDVLSDAPDGTAPGDQGENAVAAGKLFDLLNDPSSVALLADEDLGTVALVDPDGDGTYRGVFPGQQVDEEGHYSFRVDVAANAPRNGDYQRTRALSIFMRPKPDPALTDFAVLSAIGQDDRVLVTLGATPRDRFGNRIGPGYIGSLRFVASSGTQVGPVTDQGDGSYRATFSFAPGANPEIGLEVLGEEVESDALAELDGGGLVPGLIGNRWSLHLGTTFPHGALDATTDGAGSAGVDVRWTVTGNLDVEFFLGHDRFNGSGGGDDVDFTTLLGRGRWYLTSGTVRPSVFAGVGPSYDGDDLELAIEGGVAVEFPIGSTVDLELSYAHRQIDGSDDYGVAHIGLLFDF